MFLYSGWNIVCLFPHYLEEVSCFSYESWWIITSTYKLFGETYFPWLPSKRLQNITSWSRYLTIIPYSRRTVMNKIRYGGKFNIMIPFLVLSQNCGKQLFISSCLSISGCPYASPSVCLHETFQIPLDEFFLLNLIFKFFRKYVENFQFSLKSDKNNGYFTWSPM
jgi:hypothetical protein